MRRARLSKRGQITIPKPIRDRLGLRPGNEVAFVEAGPVVRLEKHVIESPFAVYRGYLSHLAGPDPDELVREMRGD